MELKTIIAEAIYDVYPYEDVSVKVDFIQSEPHVSVSYIAGGDKFSEYVSPWGPSDTSLQKLILQTIKKHPCES